MPSNYASYADAAKQAKAWSDAVLRCRTRGHSWEQDINHPENGTKEGRNFIVHFYCTRDCGVTKVQKWNARGLIVDSTMHYPKDSDGHHAYLSEIGYVDREAKGALRLATLGIA
jgi:hypothetical protein